MYVENTNVQTNKIAPSGHSVDSFIMSGTLQRAEQINSDMIPTRNNCLQCGSLIRTNVSFCTNCGKKMEHKN